MGMYTELVMAVDLKKDVPNEVLDVLRYMTYLVTDEDGEDFEKLKSYIEQTKHHLFRTTRWKSLLRSGSAYFSGKTHSSLDYDFITKQYSLSVRCNLKNYDEEIEYFLNWIKPYSSTTGFVGYYRYEESSLPTLIHFEYEEDERSAAFCEKQDIWVAYF